MVTVKRRRHEDRVAGINERLRGGRIEVDPADDFVPVELHRGGIVARSPIADRLRYGDCGGFGAPQARANAERMEKR